MKYRFNWIVICFALIITVINVSCSQQVIDLHEQKSIAPWTDVVDVELGTLSEDGKTTWYDGKLLTLEGKAYQETEYFYDRLPTKAKNIVTANVWNLSKDSAGIAIRFSTKSSFVVQWTLNKKNLAMPHMPATGVSGVDIYKRNDEGKWVYWRNARPTGMTTRIKIPAQKTERQYMAYLPLYNGIESIAFGLPTGHTIAKAPVRKIKPIIFYGTSITQGGCVSRPGMAHVAMVGRTLDWPVINLGFSGSAKCEPEMAQLLAELDPAVFVLDPLWNMPPKMIEQRFNSFVKIIRKAHPDTPILISEDCNAWDQYPTTKSILLQKLYQQLLDEGVKNLYYLSGKGATGTDGDGTVDGCHTTDLGQYFQAKNFSKALRKILPKRNDKI